MFLLRALSFSRSLSGSGKQHQKKLQSLQRILIPNEKAKRKKESYNFIKQFPTSYMFRYNKEMCFGIYLLHQDKRMHVYKSLAMGNSKMKK